MKQEEDEPEGGRATWADVHMCFSLPQKKRRKGSDDKGGNRRPRKIKRPKFLKTEDEAKTRRKKPNRKQIPELSEDDDVAIVGG